MRLMVLRGKSEDCSRTESEAKSESDISDGCDVVEEMDEGDGTEELSRTVTEEYQGCRDSDKQCHEGIDGYGEV